MTHAEQLRQIVEQFQAAKGVGTYQARDVAKWAIGQRLWAEHPESAVDRCATEISRALQSDMLPAGVRAKHAVRIVRGGLQLTLWADMRTASREHMQIAFEQRHQQIAADCRRLMGDIDYYNERHNPGAPIQLSFEFVRDTIPA